MKYLPWGLALVAGIALAVGYVQLGKSEARNAQALVDLHSAQHLSDSLTVIVDSQRQEISATKAKVDTLWRTRTLTIAVADTQGHKADSLILLAPSDSGLVCKAVRDAYNARTTECAELRKAVALDSQAIQAGQTQLVSSLRALDLLKNRNDSLGALLGRIPKAYTCKVLFVPCLSRTVSFFLGAGLGTAGTLLLRKP